MKVVDKKLIGSLNTASENQQVKPMNFLEEDKKRDTTAKNIEVKSMGYQKGHNVPEGWYVVKLVSAKTHNSNTYKLWVEVLRNWPSDTPYKEPQTISGFARRDPHGGNVELARCFGDGIPDRPSAFFNDIGIISLSPTGWIDLLDNTVSVELFGKKINGVRE